MPTSRPFSMLASSVVCSEPARSVLLAVCAWLPAVAGDGSAGHIFISATGSEISPSTARAEASRERLRSRWDGPLIGAYFGAAQGDSARPQGDSGMGQGDTRSRQGDTRSRQGDRFAPKATKDRQDSVTSVTGPTAARSRLAALRRASHGLPATPAGVVSSRHAKGDL